MVALVRPTFNQEPSQASLSMSSLIDFENNFSSQSDEMQMLEEHDTTEPRAQPPKPEGDTRKEMLLEVSICLPISSHPPLFVLRGSRWKLELTGTLRKQKHSGRDYN